MSYEAVLLDLYDTLVWSGWARWERTLAARLRVSEAELARVFDETRPARSVGAHADHDGDVAAVIEGLGLEPTLELIQVVRSLEEREIMQDIHLFEDSLPVVRELRTRGVRTALVSNCSHNTRPVVERLGLESEFDALILSFEVASRKPQPEIYRIALERVGITDPSRSVFVDDQVEYCDGAAAVGLETRLILRPDEAAGGSARSANGHRIIKDLRALL
jgi:putative hydrolase of the HAD superfamily